MATINFDSSTVEDTGAGDYTLLAKGEYEGTIVSSALKTTQTGGQYIELEFDVSGTKIFERLNLFPPKNATEGQLKAMEIAKRTMKRICDAAAKPVINDTEELHGIPMICKVDVEAGKPYKDRVSGEDKMGYDRNVIKSFAPLGGGSDIPFPAGNTNASGFPFGDK